MGVCRQYRIPHSHFLGGPLVWTDDDRNKAIAHEHHLAAREVERCDQCGTHPDDWRDPITGRPEAVVWEPHVEECEGCARIEAARPENAERWQRVRLRPVDRMHPPPPLGSTGRWPV